uniref:CSON003720 protein n=1 Tax=Culicoides sonorensis TaxID=179676 RepID=A0A336MPG1_CULSO
MSEQAIIEEVTQEISFEEIKNGNDCRFIIRIVSLYVEFKNTKNKSPLTRNGYWLIFDSIDLFQSQFWEISRNSIKREIVCDFTTKSIQFGENEPPDASDLHKFVKLVDTISHVTLEMDSISEDRLDYWSDGRKIELHIYPYGITVWYKSQWDGIHKGRNALVKEVQTDKAGAPSNEEVETLVDRLKEVHKLHYTAPHITWRVWAEFILKKKPEEHEDLVHQAPPYKIIDLFKSAGVNADKELASLRQDTSVAQGISEGTAADIDGLIQSFECVLEARKIKTAAEDVHYQKLKAFKIKMNAQTETLQLVNQRNKPQENDLSFEYFENIGDQDDVDHVEYVEEDVWHLNIFLCLHSVYFLSA